MNQNEWVILEAMGHNRVAGRYYNENGLHRIDIPDVSPGAKPGAFVRTERYGPAAIFRITSVSETAARILAGRCAIPEAIPWDVRREMKRLAAPGEPVEVEVESNIDDFFNEE